MAETWIEHLPYNDMAWVCRTYLADLKAQGLGPMAGRVLAAEYNPRLEARGKAASRVILHAHPMLYGLCGTLDRHWRSGELVVEHEV